MKNTIVVNLIAAPGTGKSTMAAGIFSKLKWDGIDAELVSEFAKELVWEERNETFKDEIYLFAKQNHRLFRVNGKVDVIVTDRPIVLSAVYNKLYGTGSDNFEKLIIEESERYNNMNFFLLREKAYNPNGRNQTEKESDDMRIEIDRMLTKHKINRFGIKANEESIDIIVEKIKKELNKA